MARSEKNLTAVFTDTASAIRAKTGTTETICPLDFADKINAIETGGSGGGIKEFLEAGGCLGYSVLKSFDGFIKYSDTENITDFSNMFNSCSLLKIAPNIDTSKATSMRSMFDHCLDMTSIPELDTSNVTNMYGMFYGCSNLTTIPKLDTSKVRTMYEMFRNCKSLTSIPNLNTSNVESMESMFSSCNKLSDVPQLDTSNVTSMNSMFNNCGNITSLPLLNTSKVNSMRYMLGGCQKLTEIPAFDCANCTDVNSLQGFMLYTYAVTAIHLRNIKVNLDISSPRNLTREAIVEVLNNLSTVTETKKLTMDATNLAKLTDEDKAIATNKGWTLA